MTKLEAIKLLNQSADELERTRMALVINDLSRAKEHFTLALRVLDQTCAIQLDTLT